MTQREWLQDQEWEIVHHRGSMERTERLRIGEGWLYRTRIRNGAHEPDSLAMTFVPANGEITQETECG